MQRPAFLEVYMENNQLFYRTISPTARTTAKKNPSASPSPQPEDSCQLLVVGC